MGQVCSKRHRSQKSELIQQEKNVKRSFIDELIQKEKIGKSSVKAEVIEEKEEGFRLYCIRKQPMIEILSKEENLKLLMQPELYQELQKKLLNEQINTKESIQIVLNIFIYCNFQAENIKNCFKLLNANNDYKEDLKQIGIYRDSSLKYYKSESCLLCLSENMECYSLKCQHIFCKDCWNQMIEIQLSNFIPIVKCLEYKCLERLPHKFLEQYQSYKEILVKRMLDNDKNFTWCPGFLCQNIYKQEYFKQKQKCHCGLKFCPNCKTENHYPITCDIYKEITQFQESYQSWTRLDISACPNCKRYIQKIQGCMQISCICGKDFCIKCSQSWNPEHGQDFYNCPFSAHNKNPSQIFNKMCQNESKIQKNIFQLEYYQKLINQQQQDEYTYILKRGLNNLIKFQKFEKIFLYYTYYLNEKFCENGFDHYYQQYSLEIQNYYRILLKQLQAILVDDQKNEKNEMIDFNIFQNQLFQMDENLSTQKQCFKKYIIQNQQEKQQNIN
ncbi:unnamed protein product [Paramecium pentaurelia]|uniref:RBR-type E3 ubiquitin transferase n=1 Tax=Paramecium pentaurelia TaxID=43138 RepID=A0A8S1VAC2_9CILI|nr:unnamed protein product [Paramecium pentaurelia]